MSDGTIRPEGLEINYISLEPGELFERMALHLECPVAEFSLSTYLNDSCSVGSRALDGGNACVVDQTRLGTGRETVICSRRGHHKVARPWPSSTGIFVDLSVLPRVDSDTSVPA